MEIKKSGQLVFFRREALALSESGHRNRTVKRVYVRIPSGASYITTHLMPVEKTQGNRINKIWKNAEHIKDYGQLLHWCGSGVQIVYTQRTLSEPSSLVPALGRAHK